MTQSSFCVATQLSAGAEQQSYLAHSSVQDCRRSACSLVGRQACDSGWSRVGLDISGDDDASSLPVAEVFVVVATRANSTGKRRYGKGVDPVPTSAGRCHHGQNGGTDKHERHSHEDHAPSIAARIASAVGGLYFLVEIFLRQTLQTVNPGTTGIVGCQVGILGGIPRPSGEVIGEFGIVRGERQVVRCGGGQGRGGEVVDWIGKVT